MISFRTDNRKDTGETPSHENQEGSQSKGEEQTNAEQTENAEEKENAEETNGGSDTEIVG